jgi:hypothetical protein
MNQVQLYGQMQSEKTAEENRTVRDIVKEISNFGINERQRWLIIYQLALEFENVDDLREVTSFIKEYKGSELFLSSKEVLDGSFNK